MKTQQVNYVFYDDCLRLLYEARMDSKKGNDHYMNQLLLRSQLFLKVGENYYFRIVPELG